MSHHRKLLEMSLFTIAWHGKRYLRHLLDLVLLECFCIMLCISAAGEAWYMRCSAASFCARLGACACAGAVPMRKVCCLILLMQSLRSSCQCA